MPRSRVVTRLLAVGLGTAVLAGCGAASGSGTDEPRASRPARDELPARLDNGADGRSTFDADTHVPPKRACDDPRHVTERSLVIRALPDGPRAPDGELAFTSGVCIYLPPGYESSGLRYPVVYLLHGSGGDAGDAVARGRLQPTMDRLIEADPDAAAIVVMPDGTDAQWYDGFDGRIRNETYLAGYLVPYVDRHFRTIATRNGRAITGVSNGGYGAILLAAKHPDLFGAAGGMSSNLDWLGARGLGDPTGDFYRANHPIELAARLADTALILDIASRCTSPEPGARCATQGLDQTFLPANRAFAPIADQVPGRRRPVDYREGDGAHDWRTWSRWLRDRQLPFFARHLADPRPATVGTSTGSTG